MCSPSRAELSEALKVEIRHVAFTEPDGSGECRGQVKALVTNDGTDSVERICVNVRVDGEHCGSFHTAREYFDVELGGGESAVIEMDIGLVSHAMMRDGYEVHLQVVGARTVTHEMPTYVLPEVCGREVSIQEGFSIATDVLVERVWLSVKKNLFNPRGEVRITYLVRNHGQAFHQGVSLLTRILSNGGLSLGRNRDRFDVIPWGERKIVVTIPLEEVSKLTAAQFAAAFVGLEDFVVGSSYFSQLRAPSDESGVEEWQGEELNQNVWQGPR